MAVKKIRMDTEREDFPITAIQEIKILKKLHYQNVGNIKEVVIARARERWAGEAKYDSKQKHHWLFCFIANPDVPYVVMLGSQGQQVQGEHLPLALACNDRLNSDRERLCFFLFCLFVDIA